MNRELAKELHRPVIKKFPRRRVITVAPNHTWSMDLADMKEVLPDNDGFRYILTCIDIYSRYAWARALKNKDKETVVEAFKTIVAAAGTKPLYIWVDRGSEFFNSEMEKYLGETKLYSTFSENKACMIERFNRTLKTSMWSYFTEYQTHKWHDILDDLVDSYNHKVHSSIKMTPAEKIKRHDPDRFTIEQSEIKEPKFAVGDHVRISRTKGIFEKGYHQGWTMEIFVVERVLHTIPVTYHLKDLQDDPVKGSFYEQEMQKTSQKDVFLVDETLDERGTGKKKEYLVSWIGYPPKFNSWIPAKDFTSVRKK